MAKHMKVKMNVKSTSDSIVQDVYEYEDKIMTFREFLEETVKITVHRYQTSKDWNERFKIFGMAGTQRADKIKNIDVDEAAANVIDGVKDGIVAVFIDGEQWEEDKLEDELPLKDGSEITFVKLTFLTGTIM